MIHLFLQCSKVPFTHKSLNPENEAQVLEVRGVIIFVEEKESERGHQAGLLGSLETPVKIHQAAPWLAV